MVVIIAALALVSCHKGNGYDKARLADGTVSLSVGGATAFVYNPLTCQMAWNGATRQFRAGTDNMSDYFVVKLSSVPSASGQTMTGDLTWTTSSSVSSLSALPLEVMQVDGEGTVWLWSQKQKAAIVMKVLR